MSIRYLRTLVTIAERGSFAAAAGALRLTQSAVSMQMKALEDEIGLPLFDRSTRPPALTAVAKALVPRAEEVIRAYDGLLRPEPDGSDIEGHLRLGAVPSVMTGIMPRALVALRAKRPRVHVELSMGLSAALVERVRKGGLDAAVASDVSDVPADLRWTPIAREPLVLIAPTEAPEGTATDLLAAYPFIRYTRQAWVGRLIDDLLRKRRIRVNETMTLDTLEAVTTMVYHGLGVSIVPQRIVGSPLPLPVRRVALPKPAVFRVVGLLRRQDDGKAALAEALQRELETIAARSAPSGEDSA
ncbi:MAG: LysR family transcriptional regulator [Hyphomicrobiaceae bacterium]